MKVAKRLTGDQRLDACVRLYCVFWGSRFDAHNKVNAFATTAITSRKSGQSIPITIASQQMQCRAKSLQAGRN